MTQSYVEGTQIELGHALITMVEPTSDPHDLAEYNRWYEHDHAYAGVLIGPGAFAYRRFVATRDLKARREPAEAPVGSFIACYWLVKGCVDEHYAWAFPGGAELAAAGRMNPNRTHVSTSLYDFDGSVNRADWPVPPTVSLDHPYQGMVAVWCRRTPSTTPDELEAYARGELAPSLLGGEVAQALTFSPRDMPGAPNSGAGVGEQVLTLFFTTADPRTLWDERFAGIATKVADAGKATLVLAQPFIPVIPGTNTYLDQLW